MTAPVSNPVSRRAALAGLGAGGLGLALAAGTRGAAAQDAAADTASHPIVGLWQEVAGGPDAVQMPWLFSIFHADGTYQSWNGLDSGAALGIWRSTGERTVELLCVYQDTDPTTTSEVPGTATFRIALALDGDALEGRGNLDVRTPDGTLIVAVPDFPWVATRVTFDVNPATGSTVTAMPATPEAGTPTT